MNWDVFITCAVTGSGDSAGKSDKVPVTPHEIADAAIEAAKEGAAIAHIHVRDPDTGAASRDPELYKQVVDRIRSQETDIIINLTAGMGGDVVFGGVEQPLPLNPAGTDMVGATERLDHVRDLLPEICTLDCGTMNFSEGDYVMTNTPSILREMARQMTALGVRPEIEIFDTGHLVMAKQLVAEGLIEDPVMVQLCMGIPYGAPNDPLSLLAMTRNIPDSWTYSAFSIGRMQLPYVAMAALAGGNVRVGLEDNLYLGKGELASNGDLVARAHGILSGMGARIMGPEEVRKNLQLTKR
jgi:3-dehydrocarnitine:acetyl-CoA trimethylamine transferase